MAIVEATRMAEIAKGVSRYCNQTFSNVKATPKMVKLTRSST